MDISFFPRHVHSLHWLGMSVFFLLLLLLLFMLDVRRVLSTWWYVISDIYIIHTGSNGMLTADLWLSGKSPFQHVSEMNSQFSIGRSTFNQFSNCCSNIFVSLFRFLSKLKGNYFRFNPMRPWMRCDFIGHSMEWNRMVVVFQL